MSRIRLSWYWLLLVVVLTACKDSSVVEPEPRMHLRVLFIGNSYTFYNDLPSLFEQVTAEAGKGRSVDVAMAAEGGYSLMNHWQDGAAVDFIHSGHFDFVVLQESSQGPLTAPARFEQYARDFDEEIRKSGASTVLFLTWALQSEPQDQALLTAAYQSVAEKLHARVAPVGPAWQSALQAQPTLPLYDVDGSHPAPEGSYLAAAVFYATLFRESPLSTSSSAEHQALQRVAWETYLKYR